ncbi:MAG: hypothetical protein KJ000_14580 [Pirellulaceae bacterium]|nr:hypothetical protein [Pirellulaceae bacterium]
MMWRRGLVLASVVLMLGVLPGCGGKGHSVSGTVRVKGGEVLKQGNVQFISAANTASGAIGQDGRYTLSSTGQGDGAAPGTYKVIFLSTEIGGGYDNPGEPVRQVIDSKYVNPTTTPIEVTVPGGTYDFELDPPAGGAEG